MPIIYSEDSPPTVGFFGWDKRKAELVERLAGQESVTVELCESGNIAFYGPAPVIAKLVHAFGIGEIMPFSWTELGYMVDLRD